MGLVNTTNENDIIRELNANASQVVEGDIDDCVIASLMYFYRAKVVDLARYAYDVTSNGENAAIQAFQQAAVDTLGDGTHAFLFKEQHWRSGRDIGSYLSACLNRLAQTIRTDVDSTKRVNAPVCPACRCYGIKEFLNYEGNLLRCSGCTTQVSTGDTNPLRKLFALHSRKGHRCPECEKFIPDSYVVQQFQLSCPYDDCLWFGTRNELSPMAHPLGLTCEPVVSLNTPVNSDDAGSWGKPNRSDWQDYFLSDDIDAELNIQSQQAWTKEAKVLREVVDIQLGRVLKQDRERALKRLLMYQAFSNMLDSYPAEMVSYLVHRKHSGEQPIQARIFQEFVRLVENELPFTLVKNGRHYEIDSLLDTHLDLFLGMSEFETEVGEDGIIPNRTREAYIGGRKMKDFGPCFIGLLIGLEVVKTGVSLMDRVRYYTFSQIRTVGLAPGLSVKATHYRIPSHYEMNGLVPLQRIRRRIVDSVYQRLNGKRRTPGER